MTVTLELGADAPKTTVGDNVKAALKSLGDSLLGLDVERDALNVQVEALGLRRTTVLEEMVELVSDLHEDADLKIDCEDCILTIGKRAVTRAADMAAIRKIIGQKVFLKLATITLGQTDDYLTPVQREKVITTTRGVRSMKVKAKKVEAVAA